VLYGIWLAAAFATTAPDGAWVGEPDVQQQLTARQVVVRSAVDSGSRARVVAAVSIRAAPDRVWDVLDDCEQAAAFIPGLRRCHLLERAPDGSWELIEHEVKYSWLMPAIHSVFHMQNDPPHSIQFWRVRGDLKDERGEWLLRPAPDGLTTTLEYQVDIDPGFWIPNSFLRRALRKELPAALLALRARVEAQSPQTRPPDAVASSQATRPR
jgi:carbon monoxide dehydrogenase subunit G